MTTNELSSMAKINTKVSVYVTGWVNSTDHCYSTLLCRRLRWFQSPVAAQPVHANLQDCEIPGVRGHVAHKTRNLVVMRLV